MKVVMVGPYPAPGEGIAGGVQRVIDTLLPELSSLVDLSLVVPGAREDLEAVSHGVPVFYQKRGPGPGALSYWTHDAKRLASMIADKKPDIVHLQAASGVGRYVSAPSIFTVHGIAHRDLMLSCRGDGWGRLAKMGAARLVEVIERNSRKKIGNTVVINPYVLEALPDVSMLRQFPIPNPADRRFIQDTGRAGKRTRKLISVGTIGPLKNTLELIEVAMQVLRSDAAASLTICGQPESESYHQACRNAVLSEGFQDRVDWPGNVGTDELIKRLDCASILLIASRQENAPMAIAEAHTRGVAVVAPEAFGIKHMIEPGKNGFFLPERVAEQSSIVRAALDHPWNRQEIARRARALYDPSLIAAQTVKAYEAVLKMHAD